MPGADDRTATALDRLLAAERDAILQGRHADLDRLARRKQDLVARLARASAGAATLARMRQALVRQDRLLATARDGMLMAQASARTAPPLTTYGPDGAADHPAPTGARVTRRL